MVAGIVQAQLELGHQVTVGVDEHSPAGMTMLCEGLEQELRSNLNVLVMPSGSAAASLSRTVDVAHIHGVWCPLVRKTIDWAHRQGIKYVLAPHGALGEWAMSQKSWKKRIALEMYYRRRIEGASLLHLNNTQEASELKLLRVHAPTAVVPHGLSSSELARSISDDIFRKAHMQDSPSPYLLFLGRLARQKAPDLLVRAFGLIANEFPELQLVVAGPDDGEREKTTAEIARLAPTVRERVLLVGPLFGDEKLSALAGATLTCVPSRAESFGIVLIEALGRGCPVVYSDRCYFPAIAAAGAGLEFSFSEEGLKNSLRMALNDPTWRAQAAKAGRCLVADQFVWSAVAKRLDSLYETYCLD